MRFIIPLLSVFFLQACVVGKAVDVVTAPVKVVGKGVDAVTTSQSEADEKRGKRLRQHEKRLGKLSKKRDKEMRKCEKGDRKACAEVESLNQDIDEELETEI